MQTQIDEIKNEVVQRIKEVFEKDFDGNNRKFARAVDCNEKTIRDLFKGKHSMTLHLLLKISKAINILPSKLLEGLELKDEN